MANFNVPTIRTSGSGPVRQKQPNLIQSIIGVFGGIALILLSPLVMSQAANQHRAKDFGNAELVSASSVTDGYIKFEGAPSYKNPKDGSACLVGACAYQKQEEQELKANEDVVCGSVREDAYTTIVRQNGYECDDDGNCETCWDVRKLEWLTQNTVETHYPLVVGAYTVNPSGEAEYIEEDETIVPPDAKNDIQEGAKRSVYSYFLIPDQLVVAGDASSGEVTQPDKRTMVLSSVGMDETALILKSRDAASRVTLMIITFAMLVFGFMLILGPLHWFGRQLRYIPFFGRFLRDASGFAVLLIAIVFGAAFWIVLLGLAFLLKIWWVTTLAYLVLLVFGIVQTIRNRKKLAGAVSQGVDAVKRTLT